MITHSSTICTVMYIALTDVHLAPFEEQAATPIKLALDHVPPTIISRAGSEKLDVGTPH